jgi:hypothetical protein
LGSSTLELLCLGDRVDELCDLIRVLLQMQEHDARFVFGQLRPYVLGDVLEVVLIRKFDKEFVTCPLDIGDVEQGANKAAQINHRGAPGLLVEPEDADKHPSSGIATLLCLSKLQRCAKYCSQAVDCLLVRAVGFEGGSHGSGNVEQTADCGTWRLSLLSLVRHSD